MLSPDHAKPSSALLNFTLLEFDISNRNVLDVGAPRTFGVSLRLDI